MLKDRSAPPRKHIGAGVLVALFFLAAPLPAVTWFIRGDADANGAVDMADALTIFGHLFRASPAALECDDAADANDADGLDISDGIYLLIYLFGGGAAPPRPFPACGIDSIRVDGLGCASHVPCLPPPCHVEVGRKVDVGGHALFAQSAGRSCPPTIVLDAGLDTQGLDSWSPVFSGFAQIAQTLGYDRAGYRTSDPGPSPRDAVQEMTELHALLENAGFDPPYVLVGHSMGGYNLRVFTGMYPAEVAGLVFVDGSHEDFFNRWREAFPDQWDQANAENDSFCTGNPSQAWCLEWEAFRTQRLIEPAPLPDVPIAVLTGVKPVDDPLFSPQEEEALTTFWVEAHAELAQSVTDGVHIVDPTSGHYIHWDNPQLVIEAVRGIVEKARQP